MQIPAELFPMTKAVAIAQFDEWRASHADKERAADAVLRYRSALVIAADDAGLLASEIDELLERADRGFTMLKEMFVSQN